MSRRDEVRVIRGRVYHADKCEHCDGEGWLFAPGDGGGRRECWFCDGKGECLNDSCTCDGCMDACEQLDAANLVSLPPMTGVEE